jgi:hypothetical protein
MAKASATVTVACHCHQHFCLKTFPMYTSLEEGVHRVHWQCF